MSALWNDLVHATYTEQYTHSLVGKGMGILAQKMWSGVAAGLPYDDFVAHLRRGGHGPGLTTLPPTPCDPNQNDSTTGLG